MIILRKMAFGVGMMELLHSICRVIALGHFWFLLLKNVYKNSF